LIFENPKKSKQITKNRRESKMSAYARDKRSKENIEVYSTDETYNKAEADGRFQSMKYLTATEFEQNVIMSSGDAAWTYETVYRVRGNKEKFDPIDGDKAPLILPRLTDYTYPKDNNDYWMTYKGIDYYWDFNGEEVVGDMRTVSLVIQTRFHNHGISGNTTIREHVDLIADCPLTMIQP
jgi:hypothetical protein